MFFRKKLKVCISACQYNSNMIVAFRLAKILKRYIDIFKKQLPLIFIFQFNYFSLKWEIKIKDNCFLKMSIYLFNSFASLNATIILLLY